MGDITYPHKFEVVRYRKNSAGRDLASVTVHRGDDRDAAQAVFDEHAPIVHRKGSKDVLRLHERKTAAE